MNKKNFIKILQNPENLTAEELSFLDEINREFPYFQISKAIYLKSLKENDDIKFKKFLRSTAAYSRDRKILFDFIKIMNKRYEDFLYVFHTTKSQRVSIEKHLNTSNLKNVEVISDEKIKNHILRKSIFAVAKSGTISFEICNQKIPSIIIYKMNFINFLIISF